MSPLTADDNSMELNLTNDLFEIEFFDPTADTLSSTLTYTTLALPALLLFEEQDSPWGLPLAYGTAIGSTLLIKSTLKLFIEKQRPPAYIDRFGVEGQKSSDSFPSGHTALSFAAASFVSVAYAKEHRDSSMALAIPAISFGFSTLSGTFRFSSGSHFPIDIFAGALIGTVTGGLCAYLLY